MDKSMGNDKEITTQVNSQELFIEAIKSNLDVDKMERLFAMRKELKAEANKEAFFIALAQFQKECPIIKKNKSVYNNNKLWYKYATLENIIIEVKVLLEKYGFSYIIKTEQDKDSVTAICQAHHKLGHVEETKFKIPIDQKSYMNAAQKIASALTFAKRYAFCDAFGIMTGDEDDDSQYSGKCKQKNIQKQTNNINKIPEENQALYKAIMILLREKQNNIDLFAMKEKTDNKKKVDEIKLNIDALKAFSCAINKIAQERRKKIKTERNSINESANK